MIYVFYFFAGVLVLLGWQSLRGGILYLAYFKQELAKPESNYTPFCSIIAPCRGLDENLRENLAALFRLDYPRYEIVFVVDDTSDKAVSVIESLIGAFEDSIPAKIHVAGKADGESQKIHNLRQAVLKVADAAEAFVFVDSDARPNAKWLRHLIAPLVDETVGGATGYRWFIAQKSGFASDLRSVWNASIASALGADTRKNFCWGGSTAMRRDVFERLNVRENWRGVLSDDFAVTAMLRAADLPIRFVPQALTATVENCSFREFLEFSTRQMKITRVYAAHLWKAALIGSLIFSTVFWIGVGLLFSAAGVHFWLTFSLLTAIFILGALKSLVRLRAVKLVLPDYAAALNRQLPAHLTLWTITPLIYFYNCCAALWSRRIIWRGIEYELKSATETVILSTNKSLK